MPDSQVNILLSERLNEAVTGKVLPHSTPLTLKNVIFNEDGLLEKRNGFLRVTQLSSARTPMRGLFATERELLAQSYDELWSWVENELVFLKRGMVAPCHVKTNTVFSGNSFFWSTDVAGSPDHFCQLGIQVINLSGTTDWRALSIGETDEGQTLFDDGEHHITQTLGERPWGVKASYSSVSNCTYIGIAAEGQIAAEPPPDSPGVLHIYEWKDTLNQAAPTFQHTISDLLYDHAYTGPGTTIDNEVKNHRTFDIKGLTRLIGTDGYAVTWINDSANDLELGRWDGSHVQQVARTITPVDPLDNFYRVAATVSLDGNDLHVLVAWEDNSTGDHVISLYTFSLDFLTTDHGPTELQRESGVWFDNLGVVEAPMGVENRIACVWLERLENGTARFMKTRSVNASHGDMDALTDTPNCAPYAGPFGYNGRIYVAATIGAVDVDNGAGTTYGTRGWNSNVLLDIEYDVNDSLRPIVIASLFDVQTANVLSGQLASSAAAYNTAMSVQGNCNNVTDLGDGRYAFMSPVLNKWYPGFNELLLAAPSSTARVAAEIRPAVNRTEVDFKYQSHAVDVNGQYVVIGGGYVVFYNGYECVELGFPVVPYIREVSIGTAGVLDDGDYFLSSHWEQYDRAGIYHRGPPSPTFKINIDHTGAADGDLLPRMYCYPGSHRNRLTMNAAVFIEFGSTAPSRALPYSDIIENHRLQRLTTAYSIGNKYFEDYKETRYDLGGDISAVAPEAARIPTISMDRLFLANMARASRIQYSDPFIPGTATEDRTAPEFNEGFSKGVPAGGEIIASDAMDDKFICWTKDRIYMVAGLGPDNAGRGNDFPPLTLVSSEVGCTSSRSVVKGNEGLYFRAPGGIYLLDRGLGVTYVSGPIEKTLAQFPNTAAAVIYEKKQLLVWAVNDDLNYRLIVHDYDNMQWFVWHVKDGSGGELIVVDLAVWNDELYALTSDGDVFKYDTTSNVDGVGGTTDWIEFRVKFAWLQAGWMRVKEVMPLWESDEDEDFRMNIALFKDFSSTNFQLISETAIASYEDPAERAQKKIRPTQQKCQAFTCEIYDSEGSSTSKKGPKLLGVKYTVMPKKGTPKVKKEQRG